MTALPAELSQRLTLRPREVAALLGLTRRQIYHHIRAGRFGAPVRSGRTVLVTREGFAAWLAQQDEPAPAAPQYEPVILPGRRLPLLAHLAGEPREPGTVRRPRRSSRRGGRSNTEMARERRAG